MMEKYFKDLGFIGPVVENDRDTVYWYRKIAGTNHHQLIVRQWMLFGKPSFEVETTYETSGEIWATTKFYGLNEETIKVNLNKLEDRLKQSIVGMGGNPQHYQYDGED